MHQPAFYSNLTLPDAVKAPESCGCRAIVGALSGGVGIVGRESMEEAP
jgi:hypothetical protein